MAKVNQPGAKTTSRVVGRVAEREEVVIARQWRPGGPPFAAQAPPRRPGRLKGRIRIAVDFDAPLPPALTRVFRDGSR